MCPEATLWKVVLLLLPPARKATRLEMLRRPSVCNKGKGGGAGKPGKREAWCGSGLVLTNADRPSAEKVANGLRKWTPHCGAYLTPGACWSKSSCTCMSTGKRVWSTLCAGGKQCHFKNSTCRKRVCVFWIFLRTVALLFFFLFALL